VARLATCFHAGFLLGLFSDPEDGGDMFLRNVGCLSTDYTALYPRRKNSSNLDMVRSSMEDFFLSPHFSLLLLFADNLTVIVFLNCLLVYIVYIILVYTQK
jgi:hypothetical protein